MDMRRIVALLLALIVAAAGAVFALAWIAAASILRPTRHAITRSPSDFGLAFEQVAFTSPDGTELRGWWVPAERPRAAVIPLHGFGSDRTELLDHAPFVLEAPFTSIDDITDRSFPHFSHPSLPSFPFAPVAVLIAEARVGRDSGTIRPIDAIGRLAPRPLLIVTR